MCVKALGYDRAAKGKVAGRFTGKRYGSGDARHMLSECRCFEKELERGTVQ